MRLGAGLRAIPPPCDLLVRNVTVVDPQGTKTAVLHNHDILIEGNRIVEIKPTDPLTHTLSPKGKGEFGNVIDGSGMAAMPGLINTHAHAPMVLFRGVAEDVTVHAWFNDIIWPMESNLTPDDVYWGAMLAAAEMIESGVATVADHYFMADRIAEAMVHSGMRAHLAPTMFGRDPRRELDESRAFVLRWQGAGDGRISVWLGPHSPYLCPPEFLKEVAEEAKRLGVGCHIHVSETADQVELSLKQDGVTPPALLERAGLFDVPVLCAHAGHATFDDIQILAGHRAGVAHCPKTLLKLAAGIAPVVAMRQAGIAVGLGTDGAASNNTMDIFEQMRLAAEMQKHEQEDPTVLTLDEALAMATTEGARGLRQEDSVGRLAPGYLADVILVRLDGTHVQPVHDVRAALVYSVRASDVDTVIVNGKVLMEGRRLLTTDKAQVLWEVAARANRLLETGHGRRLAVYPT